MSKRDYKVDSKVVAKAVKDAEKVEKIQAQIQALHAKLVEIEDDNRWMNYTSWGSDDGITEEEAIAFGKAHHTLNYASKHGRY